MIYCKDMLLPIVDISWYVGFDGAWYINVNYMWWDIQPPLNTRSSFLSMHMFYVWLSLYFIALCQKTQKSRWSCISVNDRKPIILYYMFTNMSMFICIHSFQAMYTYTHENSRLSEDCEFNSLMLYGNSPPLWFICIFLCLSIIETTNTNNIGA